jgi:hypothetical protein
MYKSVIAPLFFCFISSFTWADQEIKIPPIPNAKQINESLKGVSTDCLTTQELVATADDIKLCYKKHFIFIELLMMTSDLDFESADKKRERQIKIKKELEINSASMSLCYSQLLIYSKKEGDEKNIQYVAYRLSEIGELLR